MTAKVESTHYNSIRKLLAANFRIPIGNSKTPYASPLVRLMICVSNIKLDKKIILRLHFTIRKQHHSNEYLELGQRQ